MKNYFRVFVIITLCLALVGCQTVNKSKPLTEMSTEEKQAAYLYSPVSTPKEERPTWKKVLAVTGVILVAVPLAILMGYAASGKQVHVGK